MESEVETNKHITGLMILGATIICTCKRNYSPPATTTNYNYLVVEGVIATGQDSTIIRLKRTVNISTQSTHNPEINAVVTIEGDQGVSYGLSETDSGKYVSAPLSLDNSHKYRLKIVTADGQTYESNYEAVKITPPINSLFYNTDDSGINIYVNTNDPTNSTRYYRWEYAETYKYISPLHTRYKYQKNQFSDDTLESVLRLPSEYIDTCYVNLNSSTILINSSVALTKDVIANFLVKEIPKDSEKILHRYTIIVNQYGLTQEAYNFWQSVSRNTEKIGSIFDVQPSEISGNIHCTSNPSLPVLGYISVSTVSHQRIFIDRTELPVWPYPLPSECKTYGYCWFLAEQPPLEFTSGAVIPFGPIKIGGCGSPPLPGYDVEVADYSCADCRFHLGGKTKKPAFWK